MKSNFSHFIYFLSVWEAFSPDSHTLSLRLFLQVSLHPWCQQLLASGAMQTFVTQDSSGCVEQLGMPPSLLLMESISWTCTHSCAASAALCIEEYDLDNSACHALWLVQESLFTCMCTLIRACVETGCMPDNTYVFTELHELLSINSSGSILMKIKQNVTFLVAGCRLRT